MNICRTNTLAESVCPHLLLKGIPVNYKKELMLAFGDYIEAYEGMDNTFKACSWMCVALCPTGTVIGSWVLWKIETHSQVR